MNSIKSRLTAIDGGNKTFQPATHDPTLSADTKITDYNDGSGVAGLIKMTTSNKPAKTMAVIIRMPVYKENYHRKSIIPSTMTQKDFCNPPSLAKAILNNTST